MSSLDSHVSPLTELELPLDKEQSESERKKSHKRPRSHSKKVDGGKDKKIKRSKSRSPRGISGSSEIPSPKKRVSLHDCDFLEPKHPNASERRERSLSNPDHLLEFAKRTFSNEITDYSWLSRDSLAELMTKHQIAPAKSRRERRSKRMSSGAKVKPNSIEAPSLALLHGLWCTKQFIAPAASLLKEVLPLDVSSRGQRWVIYIMVKEARCNPDEIGGSTPQMNATVSFNSGVAHTSSTLSSWSPTWNQIFYFTVGDVKTDIVNIALYLTRHRGKDTKEGTCLGVCNLDVSSFYVPYGYYAPWDKWEVLLDPNTKKPSSSFVRLIVQLVPEAVESFADLSNETIRILPNSKQYIEQFGTHLRKNKPRSQDKS